MRALVHYWVVAWLVGGVGAQEPGAALAQIEARCDAGEWSVALADALALREHAGGAVEPARLAKLLTRIGNTFCEQRSFVPAVSAFDAALTSYRSALGAGDHDDVAVALEDLGFALHATGRAAAAQRLYEEALAMKRRMLGEDADDAGLAGTMTNLAACLAVLGKTESAVAMHRSALAMRRRLFGEIDHADIANSLSHIGGGLQEMRRCAEALQIGEEALAMRRRLAGSDDDPLVLESLNNTAYALKELGRTAEAVQRFEAVLSCLARLLGGADHENVAIAQNNLGLCLQALGRTDEARRCFETAVAIWSRLAPGRDHHLLATFRENLAICLGTLGRPSEALPIHELVLAMQRRLFGDVDHPSIAETLSDTAVCFEELGRPADALVRHDASLAMKKRLFGDDGVDVAHALHNRGTCLVFLGRPADALAPLTTSLTLRRRLLGADHPDVAVGETTLAQCLRHLGRAEEAAEHAATAIGTWRRILGDADHPDLCKATSEAGHAAFDRGKMESALAAYESALAMRERLTPGVEHASLVTSLGNVAAAALRLGRRDQARAAAARACAMAERLRAGVRVATATRQSYFDELKRSGAFEILQELAADDGAAALLVAERSRGRDLLDMMEQQRFDPFAVAVGRAERRGDDAMVQRLRALEHDLAAADLVADEVLHRSTALAAGSPDEAVRAARREQLSAESRAAGERRRQLLDERARLLGDVLAFGRTREVADLQATLQPDEALLEFTLTDRVARLYVVTRERVDAVRLPKAFAAVQRLLPGLLSASSHAQLDGRGRDGNDTAPAGAAAPASTELFETLVPPAVWERIRSMRRVFLAAHRDLHRLPFEVLTIAVVDGAAVPWLDRGPPIAYVPSGSALCWMRERARNAADDATALDALVVGDPTVMPEVRSPERGAFVVRVLEGGEGARAGLRPGDVLLQYAGTALTDDRSLAAARAAVDDAIAKGTRRNDPVPIALWREGAELCIDVAAGRLGIEIGTGAPTDARARSLPNDAAVARATRDGDLERVRTLPPLRGARVEAEAVAKVFADRDLKAKLLLGDDATETAVYSAAPRAKFLHFACHGIADEYAGESLSMLVLRQLPEVRSGDDGFLKSSDLQHDWPGRLASCRLVVLSACRTNVGRTCRDEAPQALPIGFLFAGAPTVVSSLWAVDDDSTRELMTDFYARLAAGEKDRLAAFTAAKKALRAKHPDPFRWAPFLFMGCPE